VLFFVIALLDGGGWQEVPAFLQQNIPAGAGMEKG